MAVADELLISVLISEDEELRGYVEEHKKLDNKVKQLAKRRFLTPSEDMERKYLQKKKLAGKDRIAAILTKYRNNERVVF